jgi:hypothetical protein
MVTIEGDVPACGDVLDEASACANLIFRPGLIRGALMVSERRMSTSVPGVPFEHPGPKLEHWQYWLPNEGEDVEVSREGPKVSSRMSASASRNTFAA